MSREIDERIVEMQLDNDNFEDNAKESLGTIDKLKKALNFSSTSEDLSHFQDSVNNTDLSAISSAIESIGERFTTMEIVAINVLSNIATRAVDTGIRLAKSLSVDNIAAGWQKYADKTTSVATLISQGYSMDTVSEQLDRLNWFTDETSYTFTDMVSNIAKFTAAGKGLEDSVTAMEGIATWAALSGQNASTASRAMYQLSQAMGSGVMRKEDYKSIQTASMDTKEFRQTALDAGVALGTLRKNADGTYTSIAKGAKQSTFTIDQFADHLTQEQWFNSEVMMEVFNKYSGAVGQIYEYAEEHGITASEAIEALGKDVDAFGLKAFKAAQEARTFGDVLGSVKEAVASGWMQTFELIFGNYEQSTKLWTDLANELYDVFAESGNTRNAILKMWNDLGGRDDVINAFWDIWNAIRSVVDQVSFVINEIFFAFLKLDDSLYDVYKVAEKGEEVFEDFFYTFDRSDEHMSFIAGIAAVIKQMTQKVEDFAHHIEYISRILSGEIETDEAQQKSEWFYNIIEGVANAAKMVFDVFSSVGKAISRIFDGIKNSNIFDKILYAFGGIGSIFTKFKESVDGSGVLTYFFDELGNVIEKLSTYVFTLAGAFFELVGDIGYFISEAVGSEQCVSFFTRLKEIFEKIVQSNLFQAISRGIESLTSSLMNMDFSFLDKIGAALSAVWEVLKTIGGQILEWISYVFDSIKNTINPNGELLSLNTLFDAGALIAIFDIVKSFIETFKDLSDASWSVEYFMESVGLVFKQWQAQIDAKLIESIAKSVIMIAGAMLVMSLIDSNKMAASFGLLVSAFTGLAGTFAAVRGITKFLGAGSFRDGSMLVKLAASVLILAFALKELSTIDGDAIGNALLAMFAVLAGLVLFIGVVSTFKDANLKKATKGIVSLSLGILILSYALKNIASIDDNKLLSSVMALGEILLELALFAAIAGKMKFKMGAGLGVIALAAGVMIISKTVEKFGNMPVDVLAKGLTTLGLILLELGAFYALISVLGSGGSILAVNISMIAMATGILILTKALESMQKVNLGSVLLLGVALLEIAFAVNVMAGALAGAFALSIVSLALIPLAGAFKKLSSIKWTSLAKGVLALGAGLAVIAAASWLVNIAGLWSLTGFIAALGVSIFLVGAGLVSLSAGIATFAGSATILGEAIIKVLRIVVLGLAQAIIEFVLMIYAAAPKIIEAATTILIALLEELDKLLPKFIESFSKFILNVLMGLEGITIELATIVIDIIIDILDTISKNVEPLLDSFVELIISIVNGVAEAIRGNGGDLMNALGNLASSILELFISAFEFAASKIPIIGPTIVKWCEDAKGALRDLMSFDFGENDVDIGGTTISEKGFSSLHGKFEEEGKSAAYAFGEGAKKGIDEEIPNISKSFEKSFAEGLDGVNISDSVVSSLSDALTGDGITQLTNSSGNFINQGLANGITEFSELPKTAMDQLGIDSLDAFNASMMIESPSVKMQEAGMYIDEGLALGITNNSYLVTDATRLLSDEILLTFNEQTSLWTIDFENYSTPFIEFGKNMMLAVRDGITASPEKGDHPVVSGVKEVMQSMQEVLDEGYEKAKESGKYVAQGLADGIRENMQLAIDAAYEMATAVSNIINQALQINSPSKMTYASGRFVDMGLANGIDDNAYMAEESAENLADRTMSGFKKAVSKISDIIDSDLNLNPVITPVVNLDELERSAKTIGNLMGDNSLNLALGASGSINIMQNGKAIGDISKATSKSAQGNTFTFTQNNYSPKSLSRSEIYRQTRNQFAQMKGFVGNDQ